MLKFSAKKSLLALTVGALVMLGSIHGASAAIMNYASGDGINESNNVTGANVVITAHPSWGDVGGGAQWISHVNSGYPAPPNVVVANVAARDRATASSVFTEVLGFIDGFSLNVLADDTAAVDLVNLTTNTVISLFEPFMGQINPCAPGNSGGMVGCTDPSMGIVAFTALAPGTYALVVYGMQTNADVYGVQYSGTVNTVPEPAIFVLFVAGLIVIGFATSRSRKSHAAA